jgi:ATP-dependent DNA helicase RecG
VPLSESVYSADDQSGKTEEWIKERIGEEINGEIIGELNEELNEELKRVLLLILKNGGIKAKAIASGIGRPKKTVDHYLRKLREMGNIHYIGSKKTGGYYATKQDAGE